MKKSLEIAKEKKREEGPSPMGKELPNKANAEQDYPKPGGDPQGELRSEEIQGEIRRGTERGETPGGGNTSSH